MREWKVVNTENKELKVSYKNFGGWTRPDYNCWTVCWIVIKNVWIKYTDPRLSFDYETKTIHFKEKANA